MHITFDSIKDAANLAKLATSGCACFSWRSWIVPMGGALLACARQIRERVITMPALKPGTLLNTSEEDAIITAAAMSDPDAIPFTDEEWEAVKPLARIGRPPSARPLKVPTTIRFDADVLDAFKASGKGWQTRVNEALREWLKTHSPT